MRASELVFGMTVCFKSDVEQCGIIDRIFRRDGQVLVVVRHMGDGFQGDYLRDQDTTILTLDEIWIE